MTKPYYEQTKPEAEYGSYLTEPRKEEAKNMRLVGHSDLNGWGDAFQIRVKDGICYVMGAGLYTSYGMTVLDVSNPKKPTIITSHNYRFVNAPYVPPEWEAKLWADRGYRYVSVQVPGMSSAWYAFLLRNDRHMGPEEREP